MNERRGFATYLGLGLVALVLLGVGIGVYYAVPQHKVGVQSSDKDSLTHAEVNTSTSTSENVVTAAILPVMASSAPKALVSEKVPTTPKKVDVPPVAPTNDSQIPLNLKQIPFFVMKNEWNFSSMDEFQTPVAVRPPVSDFISPSTLQERSIDPKVVVLVRCVFKGQYKGGGTHGEPLPVATLGSGVMVSPNGYILTAAHVLRVDDLDIYDLQRTWKRDHCNVAVTDKALTPIQSGNFLSDADDPRFVPVDIIFEPNEKEYNPSHGQNLYEPGRTDYYGGGADLDFALLKIQGDSFTYAPIVSKLLYVQTGEKIIGLGYPGLELNLPQSLERLDGIFNGYGWSEDSTCASENSPSLCGIRYQTKRYKADYQKLYDEPTSLGKYTSYFRGGFSGGPIFYKGNVVGLLVTGKENAYSNIADFSALGQWNWAESIASSEIVKALQKRSITIPTVP